METQISVMLLNSHAPLTTARPTVDAMVPVGGMHIYPPKSLPMDMQGFLDAATDGAIYFSLGKCANSFRGTPPVHTNHTLPYSHFRQQCAKQGDAGPDAAAIP